MPVVSSYDPADQGSPGAQWRHYVLLRARGRCECGCGTMATPGDPLEAHHVIPQQRLRRTGNAAYLWDVRNGMALRTTHHPKAGLGPRVPATALLPHHYEFAAELGLAYVLARVYPGAVPTTTAGSTRGR